MSICLIIPYSRMYNIIQQTQILSKYSHRLLFSLKHIPHYRSIFTKSKFAHFSIRQNSTLKFFLSLSNNSIRTALNRCPKVSPVFLIPVYLLFNRNQFRNVRCQQSSTKINRNHSTNIQNQVDVIFDWGEFWKILRPDLIILLLAAAVSCHVRSTYM